MVRFLAGALSCAFLFQPVLAQAPEDCVTIENPEDRLNCFDQAFLDTTITEAPAGSDWTVRVDRSELDDSTSVYMHVRSEDPLRDRFRELGPATLWVRCTENTTSVFIHFAGHFMSDLQGRGRVDFRVDALPAGNARMTASNTHEALGLWRGHQSIPFLRNSLFGGQSLYVRATPHSESAVEMRFNISGLEEEIAPLREACNW